MYSARNGWNGRESKKADVPSSRTTGHPMSTNQRSWCTLDSRAVRGQCILGYRRTLSWSGMSIDRDHHHDTVREKLTIGFFCLGHVQFAKTEVAKSNVACVIEKDIFRFEITYDSNEFKFRYLAET